MPSSLCSINASPPQSTRYLRAKGVGRLPTLNLPVLIAVKINVYRKRYIPKLPCGVVLRAANL